MPKSGRYEMTIFFVTGERRDAYLQINNGQPQRLSFSGQGGVGRASSRPGSPSSSGRGENGIVFGNPWDRMPRLGRITISG